MCRRGCCSVQLGDVGVQVRLRIAHVLETSVYQSDCFIDVVERRKDDAAVGRCHSGVGGKVNADVETHVRALIVTTSYPAPARTSGTTSKPPNDHISPTSRAIMVTCRTLVRGNTTVLRIGLRRRLIGRRHRTGSQTHHGRRRQRAGSFGSTASQQLHQHRTHVDSGRSSPRWVHGRCPRHYERSTPVPAQSERW